MNRSKKYLRKTGIDHDSLVDKLAQQNLEVAKQEQAASLVDSQLFSVNLNKEGLSQKRAKLAKDRFKVNQEKLNAWTKSKTEQALLKKIRAKNPPQQQKIEKIDEFADIWATPTENSKQIQRFKDFTTNQTVKVKAVIKPLPGQSFNPTASAHLETLRQVVKEEVKEIEHNFKGTLKQHAMAVDTYKESDQEENNEQQSDQDSDREELVNKPVARERKKTQTELNKKLLAKANKTSQDEAVRQRKLEKQYKNMQGYIKISEKKSKLTAEQIRQRKLVDQQEIENQVKEGVVEKPKIIGRFKYSMRKTDFQLEDELAASVRQIKPIGQDDLLRERFDSVFRRNLVEPDAPTEFDKKRQKKAKFKWRARQGPAMGGTLAGKLKRKNQKLASEKNSSKQDFFKDDLILI